MDPLPLTFSPFIGFPLRGKEKKTFTFKLIFSPSIGFLFETQFSNLLNRALRRDK